MKKKISLSACLQKNNETLFIQTNGDVYSTQEYVCNLYENLSSRIFNCREKQLCLKTEIRRLQSSGYSPLSEIPSETVKRYREVKRLHQQEKHLLQDFLEFNFID
jgi:hypothetical protein